MIRVLPLLAYLERRMFSSHTNCKIVLPNPQSAKTAPRPDWTDHFNKCVDMQKKKLEELQERAKRQMENIEEKKKNDEKIDIEDIEV